MVLSLPGFWARWEGDGLPSEGEERNKRGGLHQNSVETPFPASWEAVWPSGQQRRH